MNAQACQAPVVEKNDIAIDREQLILEHMPLIRYIVNRIAVRLPSHIDLDDLHSTGVIGLMIGHRGASWCQCVEPPYCAGLYWIWSCQTIRSCWPARWLMPSTIAGW